MRKMKKIAILIVSLFIVSVVPACGVIENDVQDKIENEEKISAYDVSDWEVPDGARVVPVDEYSIGNGRINGAFFVEYVDLETGCMYLYTEHYQCGYGTTFTPLMNPDGSICVYDEDDLDDLRDKFDYER